MLAKTALKSLTNHPGRSLLTIVGIMIGIAAIIMTMSIGKGAEDKVSRQIMVMGKGAVYILPGNVIGVGAVRSNLAKPMRLTKADMEAIQSQVPEIREVSRGFMSEQLVTARGNALKDQILGVDPSMLAINRNVVEYGTFFTKYHLRGRANVAIIGSETRAKLFGKEIPINKPINIAGFPFVVIGVLQHQEQFWGTNDPNKHIFIPFTTAKKYFKKSGEFDDDLGFIALSLPEGIESAPILRTINRILRFTHNMEPGEENNFLILDQQAIGDVAKSAAHAITLFGLIAASISLLVGGIGIMNIMLVSVQERTEEIGLRLALGATRSLVLTQFLIESALLCFAGGIIGVATGLAGGILLKIYTKIPCYIAWIPAVVSLVVTLLLGIFFGLYPAYRASLLDPIKALTKR